jgi:hypothetical protein
MRLARWIFLIAGIYGVLVLLPGFFVELAGRPQAQPEFYYGSSPWRLFGSWCSSPSRAIRRGCAG